MVDTRRNGDNGLAPEPAPDSAGSPASKATPSHEKRAGDGDAYSLSVLQHRLARSRAAQDDALRQLREVMTDAEALADYGIDTTQL